MRPSGRIFFPCTTDYYDTMTMDLKITITHALDANDLEKVAVLAEVDRKVMSQLIRLAYNKDTIVGWRAILAIGLAARKLAGRDQTFLRETCRKLLWSLTDESGGIGWSAPEILGEIVSSDPQVFADLVPLVASVFWIEEKVFRPGVLYALKRIAEAAPSVVIANHQVLSASLLDRDPLVKVRGLRLLAVLWRTAATSDVWPPEFMEEIKNEVRQLLDDHGEVWIYEETGFASVQVGELARIIHKTIN
jgi:hypothetical protein